MKRKMLVLLIATTIAVSTYVPNALGQENSPLKPYTLTIPLQGESPQQAMQDSLAGLTLPLWSYWAWSPVNFRFYSGYIMGRTPGTLGSDFSGNTYIPTYIIPLILRMPDGGVFDPTRPDPTCSPAGTPLALVQHSPLFNNAPMVWGGTNVGTTQYIDAQLRAEFWSQIQGTVAPWHTKFLTRTLRAITVNVPQGYGYTTGAPCGNLGVIDHQWLDSYVKSQIPLLGSQGVGPRSLPLFLLYNVEQTSQGFTYLGYHSAYGPPLQVYSVATFDTTGAFPGSQDITILSHELGEAANDPTGMNYTPPWGHIGQVQGCQNNFEVGDPLTGNFNPPITLNGYTYHPQELAFFAWFFRTRNTGVNGWYSTNGTFTTNAGPVCM